MSSTENPTNGTQQDLVPEVPQEAPATGTPPTVTAEVGGAEPSPAADDRATTASAAVPPEAGTPAAPAPADAALADPTSETATPVDTPAAEIDGAGLDVADATAASAPAPETTDTPATDTPATDVPTTDAPATDVPTAEAPTADAPVPSDDAPVAAAPADESTGTPAAGDAPAGDPAPVVPGPGRPQRPRGGRGQGSRAERQREAAPPAVVVPPVPPSDPTEWGRVDEEGTVYVRTADGERPVGNWQAGEPAEGLAHYGRRYDDLTTEVTLLEARLTAHQGNPNELRTKAQALVDAIPTAAAVGDLVSLALRAQTIVTIADAAIAVSKVERAEARTAAIARKEELVTEAEAIGAESTQWKASGDRLKAIVEEWKTIKGIDRKTDEALWTRFAAARDAFGRRRGTHFAALDVARNESRGAKKELIAEAERLSRSTEWGPTSAAMRQLMDRWKAVPRTGRDTDDDLWKQFRAAQDVFFAARTAQDQQRNAEHTANQEAKEAILAEAEALDPSAKGSQNALRKLQERYDAVGHVPRESMRRLEDRMQAVEETFRGSVDAGRPRVAAPENPLLTSMRAAVTKAEEQLSKAAAAGNAKRVAEAQANLTTRREWLAEAEKTAGRR